MDKANISIDPEQWGNLVTKYQSHSPRLSKEDFSAGTINVDTDTNGSLSKRKGGPNYNPTLLATAPKDQYEAIFSDGARHLLVVANGEFKYSSGDTIFNTVANGTGFNAGANFEFATTQDRVYGCNAVNSPIVYDRIAVYGGAAPVTVPRTKTMGAQAPASAPTGAVAAGGAVPIGGHTYKVTYVYYDSEESNGGPASSLLTTTGGNQTINLTAIPIGGYGVTQRGIYRDNNDGNWVLLTYITNNTATVYSDVLAVGVTPIPIPDNNGVPPTFGLIKEWLNRLWLAQVPGDPYTLFYSETDLPDIFGSENQLLCNQEDPITALVVYFDRMMVFNRRSMGQILGSTPDTFRYAAIPSSIGCVDNRTLQTHVLHGVPVLIWLSERGFYTYDGNSIEYVSDPIEDLINYNIRQATQQKNSNTISSQTQFQSGTPSQGIDTVSLSGSVTTKGYQDGTSVPGTNPRRNLDDAIDWNNGTVKANLAIESGDNALKAVTTITPNLSSGTRSGALIFNGGALKLTTSTDYIGTSWPADVSRADLGGTGTSSPNASAIQWTCERSGIVTSLTMRFGQNSGVALPARIRIYADAGDSPAGVLYETNFSIPIGSSTNYPVTVTPNITTVTNQKYWFSIEILTTVNMRYPAKNTMSGSLGFSLYKRYLNGAWRTAAEANALVPGSAAMFVGSGLVGGLPISVSFSATPIAKSGSWESPIFNTNSITLNQCFLTTQLGSPTAFGIKTASFIAEASTDGLSFTQVYMSTSLSGVTNQSISLTGQRWFRFRLNMATTDDRETHSFTFTKTMFPDPTEWISEVIDMTSDVTVYNSLSVVSTVPSGTALTVTVATSADNITYTSYGPIGAASVQRYMKIKATLSKDAPTGAITPTLTSLVLKWTLVSNLVSPVIDTAVVPPAGWDVFLAQYTANGGTVQFQMRSGSTNNATPGTGVLQATFYTVTPSEFPTVVAPLQFVQWKMIITSSDLTVPVVDSVTIQWLISLVASIRPASIFVDGRYYVALAELNQTSNNLIIQLDLNMKWRRLAGISVATFSFFFNRPYYGLSTSGQIRKFLDGYTDGGTPIEYDIRTKAFDFSTQYKDVAEKYKIVGEVIIHAKNTGAAIQVMYSPDEGVTFYPFYTLSGATSYQTTTDGADFFLRLKPSWTSGVPIAGQHMMYRIYNNDIYNVEVHSLKATVLVRKQPPVITG